MTVSTNLDSSRGLIFSSGGTGGHIFPTVNLMKHFFNKGYKVLLVTEYHACLSGEYASDVEIVEVSPYLVLT